jgi:hypothetical protein
MDNSSEESGFEVLATGPNNVQLSFEVPPQTNIGTVSFDLTGLQPATTYTLQVGAESGGPSIAWSPVLTTTTLVVGQPLAPSDVIATADGDGHTMHLTWADNSDNESGFTVEQLQDDGITWLAVAHASADATTADVTGLYSLTEYQFVVVADAPATAGGQAEGGEGGEQAPPHSPPSEPTDATTEEGNGMVFQGDAYGTWISADGVQISWSSSAPSGEYFNLLNDTITAHLSHLPKHCVLDAVAEWSSVSNDGDDQLTLSVGSFTTTRTADYGSDHNDLYAWGVEHQGDDASITISGANWSSDWGTFGFEHWALNSLTVTLKRESIAATNVDIATPAVPAGTPTSGTGTSDVTHNDPKANGAIGAQALTYKIVSVTPMGKAAAGGKLTISKQTLAAQGGVTNVQFKYVGPKPPASGYTYAVKLQAKDDASLVCNLLVTVK